MRPGASRITPWWSLPVPARGSVRPRGITGMEARADFLFAQVSFSIDQIMDWRASVEFQGPVYAGVMVVGSAQMAAKLSSEFPQLAAPAWRTEQLETNKEAGVDFACDLVCQFRDSGAFDGHPVPVRRYREVARRLEALL